MNKSDPFNFPPIATIESPYREKFAIPRQPGLVTAAKGKVVFSEGMNDIDLVRDIEQFSHLWLIFVFHGTAEQGWKPLVRPPRLGGNKKTGVLATRTTFRPNPIGMSVVKLDNVEEIKLANGKKQLVLNIAALDLLDGTPIIDIKPYIPYSDAITSAKAGFAQQAPATSLTISFSKSAQGDITHYQKKHPELKTLITQVLQQDPRPAYKKDKTDTANYGMSLFDLNINWKLTTLTHIEVLAIEQKKQ